ncbi:MAG: radical SAM protein, partial [Deltaproteobacteria bacterium]|nr:radical SAM protein [Deltaproteobacteria bacterium]
LCPHFHIPLQSADDDILKRMGRPYTADFFAQRVRKIHQRLAHAAIGADVLIGFPGESDAAFQNTIVLIESLPLTYLHVFPFSPRTGTPAEHMPNQVPVSVVKERCRQIRELGVNKKRQFYDRFVGKQVNVLLEAKRDKASGLIKGQTANYIPILVDGSLAEANTIVSVKIEKRLGDRGMLGGRS